MAGSSTDQVCGRAEIFHHEHLADQVPVGGVEEAVPVSLPRSLL
ncbi:hypothetical protein [Actinokineospora cianjurensis]|nr:hypothetical protein [Actinokineospora cianjurensis]